MTRIFVPSRGPEDWRRLLASPETQWRAGFSAMAAALSWEAAKGLPPEIAAILGPGAELLLAIPEHKVSLPGGGRASQCDVFALVRTTDGTVAVAIEAKVNEPFGPTVGEWLKGASAGKIARLDAIRSLLGLPDGPLDHLRYQLLHRSAAAVIEATRFGTDHAAMIVQSFSQEHRWLEDFATFAKTLGHEARRAAPLQHELPTGQTLILGWATGSAVHLVEPPPDGRDDCCE